MPQTSNPTDPIKTVNLRNALLDQLAAPLDRVEVTELLSVPHPDGSTPRLFIQELSGIDKAEWQREVAKDGALSDALLVMLCLVGEDGSKVFKRDDLPALSKRSALTTKLARTAAHVSGLFWQPEELLKGRPTTSPSNGQRGQEAGQ